MITKKLLFPALFAIATVIFTGCQATGGEVRVSQKDEIRAMAEEALGVANEALRAANTASYDAATAKDMALSAQDAANAAQACCDANSRRMSRMFSGSMSSK